MTVGAELDSGADVVELRVDLLEEADALVGFAEASAAAADAEALAEAAASAESSLTVSVIAWSAGTRSPAAGSCEVTDQSLEFHTESSPSASV